MMMLMMSLVVDVDADQCNCWDWEKLDAVVFVKPEFTHLSHCHHPRQIILMIIIKIKVTTNTQTLQTISDHTWAPQLPFPWSCPWKLFCQQCVAASSDIFPMCAHVFYAYFGNLPNYLLDSSFHLATKQVGSRVAAKQVKTFLARFVLKYFGPAKDIVIMFRFLYTLAISIFSCEHLKCAFTSKPQWQWQSWWWPWRPQKQSSVP